MTPEESARRRYELPSGVMTRLLMSMLRHHLPPLRGPESTAKDLWFLLRQQRYGDALLVAMRHDRDWTEPRPGSEERERIYEAMAAEMRAPLHERLPTPDGMGVEAEMAKSKEQIANKEGGTL